MCTWLIVELLSSRTERLEMQAIDQQLFGPDQCSVADQEPLASQQLQLLICCDSHQAGFQAYILKALNVYRFVLKLLKKMPGFRTNSQNNLTLMHHAWLVAVIYCIQNCISGSYMLALCMPVSLAPATLLTHPILTLGSVDRAFCPLTIYACVASLLTCIPPEYLILVHSMIVRK